MDITKVKTTVKEFFERKDEFMFPPNGDEFIEFIQRCDMITYSDVTGVTDTGRYSVVKTSGKHKATSLLGHTIITVSYYKKEKEPVIREKLETFEQLVARVAPRQYSNLAGRTHDYETTNQTIHSQASS